MQRYKRGKRNAVSSCGLAWAWTMTTTIKHMASKVVPHLTTADAAAGAQREQLRQDIARHCYYFLRGQNTHGIQDTQTAEHTRGTTNRSNNYSFFYNTTTPSTNTPTTTAAAAAVTSATNKQGEAARQWAIKLT
jgi:hypothetical protein